jgi:hypothetical protein
MKALIVIAIISLGMGATFQNCSKNNAVQFDTIKTKALGEDIIPQPIDDLPPIQSYKACNLPDSTTVNHLYYTWGLKNTGTESQTCDLFEVRQCFDGIMNPSNGGFNTDQCITPALVDTGAGQNPCDVEGRAVAHGQLTISFNTRIATGTNNCIGQIRRCNNGALSGSSEYNYATCGESFYKPANDQAYDCTLNGLTIPDGTTTIAFKEENPVGLCDFEPRRCIQGRLSGSFTKAGCVPK